MEIQGSKGYDGVPTIRLDLAYKTLPEIAKLGRTAIQEFNELLLVTEACIIDIEDFVEHCKYNKGDTIQDYKFTNDSIINLEHLISNYGYELFKTVFAFYTHTFHYGRKVITNEPQWIKNYRIRIDTDRDEIHELNDKIKEIIVGKNDLPIYNITVTDFEGTTLPSDISFAETSWQVKYNHYERNETEILLLEKYIEDREINDKT